VCSSLMPNNHTLPSHLRLCSLFVASYDSQGLRWKYSNPPPHGVTAKLVLSCPFHYKKHMSLHFTGNEINKPLHSNGHLPNTTHVGGSHILLPIFSTHNLNVYTMIYEIVQVISCTYLPGIWSVTWLYLPFLRDTSVDTRTLCHLLHSVSHRIKCHKNTRK
jgi:hypothetical protein